eukprot:GCRY01002027.1.p1 GENE.GCRY01002027.1~~GCRY01002027.1.p1  ORF type:complete len:368 (+),score=57.96 GCRY01002027.1:230-1333(+)
MEYHGPGYYRSDATASAVSSGLGFEGNNAFLTNVSAQANPKAQSSESVSLPYGDFPFAKLIKELRNTNEINQSRSLERMLEILSDPKNTARAFDEEIFVALREVLETSKNDGILEKAAQCLCFFSEIPAGRIRLVESGYFGLLKEMVNKHSDKCRELLFRTLFHVVQYQSEVDSLAEDPILTMLPPLLATECRKNIYLILKALTGFSRSPLVVRRLVEDDIIQRIKPFLQAPLLDHCSAAVALLVQLAESPVAKAAAVDAELIPLLRPLLTSPSADVIANAALAVLHLTVSTEGKQQASTCDIHQPLLKLAAKSPAPIQKITVKVLRSIAELPAGRDQILEHMRQAGTDKTEFGRQLIADVVPKAHF